MHCSTGTESHGKLARSQPTVAISKATAGSAEASGRGHRARCMPVVGLPSLRCCFCRSRGPESPRLLLTPQPSSPAPPGGSTTLPFLPLVYSLGGTGKPGADPFSTQWRVPAPKWVCGPEDPSWDSAGEWGGHSRAGGIGKIALSLHRLDAMVAQTQPPVSGCDPLQSTHPGPSPITPDLTSPFPDPGPQKSHS